VEDGELRMAGQHGVATTLPAEIDVINAGQVHYRVQLHGALTVPGPQPSCLMCGFSVPPRNLQSQRPS
jgi:hypothetical protein